jgi:transcriptional regulator with XRE-family HTH domain
VTPRGELAALLRQARITAGYSSQAKLAKALHVSRPLISRAENAGEALPSVDVLAGYAAATRVDAAKIADLTERIRSSNPQWFVPYRNAEAEAHTLRCWAPLVVPGLLQVEGYARSILAVEFTGKRLDELVMARMERQKAIGRAHVTAIIDQHVLYRLIGTAAVMAEQLAHLASLAERRDIALHVLPEGTNMGTWGAFDLATRDSTTTVCLTTVEDVTTTAADMVVKTMQAYEQILGAAMPCSESLAAVRTAEDQWKTRI